MNKHLTLIGVVTLFVATVFLASAPVAGVAKGAVAALAGVLCGVLVGRRDRAAVASMIDHGFLGRQKLILAGLGLALATWLVLWLIADHVWNGAGMIATLVPFFFGEAVGCGVILASGGASDRRRP